MALICSCTELKQLNKIKNEGLSANIILCSSNVNIHKLYEKDSNAVKIKEDKIAHTDLYGDVSLMDVEYDENTGEAVILDKIDAVVVEASYKNVVERKGIIELAFDILVPKEICNENWQLSFTPVLYYLSDSLALGKVNITGEKYRDSQLRGYELYDRFLKSILPDNDFINNFCYERLLEIFLRRNYNDIFKLKLDSLNYDKNYIENLLGNDGLEAVKHYTKQGLVKRNNRRKDRIGEMYAKYVKVPIDTVNILLDTVISVSNDLFKYRYKYSFETLPKLKQIDLLVRGEILDAGNVVHTIPNMERQTYYVSSISWFVDDTPKYIAECCINEQDSIKTILLDTLYMKGVEAIKNRDYKQAITCLNEYKDYNLAVAYLCLDYNNSALKIIETLEETPKVLYMKSLLYVRLGYTDEAVKLLERAIGEMPSLRFRANLDPETNSIIKRVKIPDL